MNHEDTKGTKGTKMNVYEAIEASPIGVAWHEVGRQTICSHESCRWQDKNFPDGWQPLYTSPAEYTLGEPLTEATGGQRYIAVHNGEVDQVDQGVFSMNYQFDFFDAGWTYYADPRPLPKLPEKKPRYTLRDCGAYWRVLRDEQSLCVCENRLDAEGLVKLLNESEAKDE